MFCSCMATKDAIELLDSCLKNMKKDNGLQKLLSFHEIGQWGRSW